MSESEEIQVSKLSSELGFDPIFPEAFSFFEPYLPYFIKETIELGGEAYLTKNSEDDVSGVFIYDEVEKTGTIFTRSKKVFDYFYKLKPFNSLFAELRTEPANEIYDIYTLEMENREIVHSFNHQIALAEKNHISEIERFMELAHPEINRKWVKVALKNGDKCFIVSLGNEIAGLGWVSFVKHIGRIHSLYVKPQFRKLGIGEDILYARLLWLKTNHALSAFSEISRHNVSSSRIALKAKMNVSAQLFQYFKNPITKKPLQSQ